MHALLITLFCALILTSTPSHAEEPLAPLGTLPSDQPAADQRDIDEGWIYDSLLEPAETLEFWVPDSDPVEWISIPDPE